MAKARKYVVRNHFNGLPKRYDYEIIEYELPPLQKNEILIKTEWISVDPYHRSFNNSLQLPYEQFGYQVGLVTESKDPEYPVGARVVTHKGWCTHAIVNTQDKSNPDDKLYKLPDLQGLSSSLGVGAVGMPGATAYFGFLELCQPKPGETVVVTGAAGAVGSLVGQIAKIKGCRVIGFTGSDDKVQWLQKTVGFDKAYNYKTINLNEALKEAAPTGIDCYFDNVGGPMSSTIMTHMKQFGRVACCGSISGYNETQLPLAPMIQPSLVGSQLRVEGFMVNRWSDQWPRAFADIVSWIKSGQLNVQEHVTEGFDDVFEAFVGMLKGENTGKAVVKV